MNIMGLPKGQQVPEALRYPEYKCRSEEVLDILLHLSAKRRNDKCNCNFKHFLSIIKKKKRENNNDFIKKHY